MSTLSQVVPRRDSLVARLDLGGLRVPTIAALAATIVLFAWLPYIAYVRGWEAFILCLAGTLAFVAAASPILLRSEYDVFEPITFVTLTVLIGTTLKAFYVVLRPTDPWVTDSLLLGRDMQFLTPYAVLITLSLLMMAAGYFVRVPRLRIERLPFIGRTNWSLQRLVLMGVVFFIISVVATAMYVRKMGIQVTSLADISGKHFYETGSADAVYGKSALTYYRWGASLITPVYYLFLAWFLGSGKKLRLSQKLMLFGLGLSALALPILNSSRTSALAVLVVTVLIYTYMRRSLNLGPLTVMAIVVVGLFTAISALRPKNVTDEEIAARLGGELLLKETVGGRHFLDLTKTALIIEAVPSRLPYSYGATMVKWLVAPIPRTMWPGKPIMGTGPIIGTQVFGFPDVYTSGVSPGIVAELYMNFGVLGSLLGMFVFGLVLRMVWRSFQPNLSSPNGVVIYSAIIITLSYGILNGDFGKNCALVIRDLLPIIACLLFVARPGVREKAV